MGYIELTEVGLCAIPLSHREWGGLAVRELTEPYGMVMVGMKEKSFSEGVG